MSWVARSLQLQSVEERIVHLQPRPGSGSVSGFVNDRQREQLAQLFTQVVGRPIKVQIHSPQANPSSPDTQAPASTTRSPANNMDVLNLPLVSQLSSQFDVSVVNVREESQNDDITAEATPNAPMSDPGDAIEDDLLEEDSDV